MWNLNCPEMIMLMGLPGSGKSTLASALEYQGYHIFSGDRVRQEIYGDINHQSNPKEVFDIVHQRIKRSLYLGIPCVYDATNIKRKDRLSFLQYLKDNNISCKTKVAIVVTPVRECVNRIIEREKQTGQHVPGYAFMRMLKNFQVPTTNEGWEGISIMPDPAGYKPLDFSKLNQIDYDEPRHVENISEHTKMVYDQIACNDQLSTDDKWVLLDAAQYHDVGKPYTKSFVNREGNISWKASYHKHENVSTYLYLADRACGMAAVRYHNGTNYSLTPDETVQLVRAAGVINYHKAQQTQYSSPHLTELIKTFNQADKQASIAMNKQQIRTLQNSDLGHVDYKILDQGHKVVYTGDKADCERYYMISEKPGLTIEPCQDRQLKQDYQALDLTGRLVFATHQMKNTPLEHREEAIEIG